MGYYKVIRLLAGFVIFIKVIKSTASGAVFVRKDELPFQNKQIISNGIVNSFSLLTYLH